MSLDTSRKLNKATYNGVKIESVTGNETQFINGTFKVEIIGVGENSLGVGRNFVYFNIDSDETTVVMTCAGGIIDDLGKAIFKCKTEDVMQENGNVFIPSADELGIDFELIPNYENNSYVVAESTSSFLLDIGFELTPLSRTTFEEYSYAISESRLHLGKYILYNSENADSSQIAFFVEVFNDKIFYAFKTESGVSCYSERLHQFVKDDESIEFDFRNSVDLNVPKVLIKMVPDHVNKTYTVSCFDANNEIVNIGPKYVEQVSGNTWVEEIVEYFNLRETTQTGVIPGLYLVTFEVNSEAGDAGTYVFGIEINDSQCVTKVRGEGFYEVFNIEDIMQEDNSIYFEALNLKILPDYANKTYAFDEQNKADNLAQGINFTKIEKVNLKEFNSGIFAE